MSRIMKNPPVYFALAYIGFDEVKALSKYIPDVQELFRKAGFTKYTEQQSERIAIEEDEAGSGAQVSLVEESVWIFGKSDQKTNVVLTESGLTLQTTAYTEHSDFFRELTESFNLVKEAVGIDTVLEISLRYFDAVLPAKGKEPNAYLASEKPSELVLNGDRLQHRATNSYSLFNSKLQLDDDTEIIGNLMVGTNWFTSRIGLPPDITVGGLKFDERFVLEDPEEHVVVDFQHRVAVELEYDEALVSRILSELHTSLKSAFEVVFSDVAWSEWK
ncbi:TIGR04255 family protein [Leisingera daeponensis]|uniref:TIGR04255 family protein n=1 Tax=Leisingera daeponensis TaxID=405746 RepID=UPI001C9508C9|nr:TIGR04255 family protein [Leisingera daeponensis]MBY6056903.1 TIGR04255 family protein [Leisingera daeponensis]